MSDDRPDQTGPIPPGDHTRPIPAAGPPHAAGPPSPQAGHASGPHPGAPQAHPHPGYAAPPQQAYAPGGVATAPRRGLGKAAIPVTALLAAVLASGGTYALTHDEVSTPAAAPNTTVVDANPADFADAGTINWSATASKVTPSVVAITATSGAPNPLGQQSGGRGSGVILDAKGNIVTNNHVVAGSSALRVTLSDNRTYEATTVGTDPSTDLAVIRLKNPPKDLKPITLGDDRKLVVGQPVMAVGNPLGLAGTVTTGIVSALNRPVETEAKRDGQPEQQPGQAPSGANEVVTNAIQTSAPINPGNSGGALVDGSGRLIGINSSIATLSGSQGGSQSGNIGIGFAIPVTVVKNITGQLIASGKAQHAQLGVSVRPGTVTIDGATVTGARVESVQPGSGAAKAGIKQGDVILAIDGEAVESSTSLVGQVRERTAGQRVALTVVRDGQRQNVTVTLVVAPAT